MSQKTQSYIASSKTETEKSKYDALLKDLDNYKNKKAQLEEENANYKRIK